MFPISYRDLELMLQDRGVTVDHTTIFRWIQAYLGFGQLCGVAERMDDAIAEGGADFSRRACTPRGEETLLTPELAPNRGRACQRRWASACCTRLQMKREGERDG